MSKFQERFCHGIKRESTFSSISMQKDRSDRIPLTLQREKTFNPERSVYSIQRDKSFYGDRVNLSFPRERAFQTAQQRKTVKFQKLCGWRTPDIEDGVVEWVKTQLQIHGRKDRQLRLSKEDSVFRYIPKQRCSGLDDAEQFESESLHPNYFISEQKEKEAKVENKRKQTAPKVKNESNNDVSGVSATDQTRRLLRSRSKDDMGVLSAPKKSEDNLDKYIPTKRCKSVTNENDNSWKVPGNSSQLKRLLKCARLYHSKDNDICDVDDDEGYGSKTSSADDKLHRGEFWRWELPPLDIDNEFKTFGSMGPMCKPAKFSYTHQTSKAQLYGDSDDEGVKDMDTERTEDSSSGIKYYKTGYQSNTPNYITRLLEKTYSQISCHNDNSDLLKIRELKTSRVPLRKISIQDSNSSSSQEKDNSNLSFNNQKEFYDQQKTLVRSNSTLQSDRTQYPLYCTSPELKFTTNHQRPASKRNHRSIREEHSQRLAQTELLNKTRFPYLDFYRAHSSVNLPLSDLLPAVDRNLKGKISANKQGVTENISTCIAELPRKIENEATKSYPEPPQLLGGPTFRENIKSPAESALKRQPSCILDYYQNPSKWIHNQSMKFSDAHNQGITSLEMTMSGIDVGIKRDINKKKPIGTVRLSGNPDKDAKKKLREAFSTFYNTRSSMKNRDWASDFKYIWNT